MKELENALGTEASQLLRPQGIDTLQDLQNRTQTERECREFAHSLGLPSKRVQTWLQRADIFRVQGIGKEYTPLFLAARIHSVQEIASQTPQQLQERLMKANRTRKLVRRAPSIATLTKAVQHASRLAMTE